MAVKAALDAVRESFGWAYGSYWQVHSTTNVLHFETESGDAGAEFREVTLSAGMSGLSWLVFVRRTPSCGWSGMC